MKTDDDGSDGNDNDELQFNALRWTFLLNHKSSKIEKRTHYNELSSQIFR